MVIQLNTQELEDWRRSARQVTRTWEAWLGADGGERGICYDAFVLALDAEERAAAEIERSVPRTS